MRLRFSVSILGLFLLHSSWAQVSPYTGQVVRPPDSTGAYRILIGGHFHGSSSNASGYPAATVLANLSRINATNANIFLSTGDLFLRPDRDSARYASSFFSQLALPLFNAPGNHDLEGKAYNNGDRFPQTIAIGRDRILLLDTERNDSDIRNEQLAALNELVSAAEAGELDRVFIVTHRPIWAEADARYGDLFKGNTRALAGCNFESEVRPVLRRAAVHSTVYWISGSMAGGAPASIFFQPDEPGITFIQCAIRDELRDALLLADITPGEVRWSAISLTGKQLENVENYDRSWWLAHKGNNAPIPWRRTPYLVKKAVTTPVFWYGFATALVLLLLVRRIARRGLRN